LLSAIDAGVVVIILLGEEGVG